MIGSIAVDIEGTRTNLLLRPYLNCPSVQELEAFERQLGCRLPDTYRSFLLLYNGGEPVVGDLANQTALGLPYEGDDLVDVFFSFGASVPAHRRLRPSGELPWVRWCIPGNNLVVASDPFGNVFALSLEGQEIVRFVDHERLDLPFEEQRVVIRGFVAFLNLFRSPAEVEAERVQLLARERASIEGGPLPAAVEERCSVLVGEYSMLRAWIRACFLVWFDVNGSQVLTETDDSFAILDLVMWLDYLSRGRGVALAEFQVSISTDWNPRQGLGVRGYAPETLANWWRARLNSGLLVAEGECARPSAAMSERVLAHCRSLVA